MCKIRGPVEQNGILRRSPAGKPLGIETVMNGSIITIEGTVSSDEVPLDAPMLFGQQGLGANVERSYPILSHLATQLIWILPCLRGSNADPAKHAINELLAVDEFLGPQWTRNAKMK